VRNTSIAERRDQLDDFIPVGTLTAYLESIVSYAECGGRKQTVLCDWSTCQRKTSYK